MNHAKRRGPAQSVMRECDHCDGLGEVQVYCDDCGDGLDTDSAAEPDRKLNPDLDDICKQCLASRKEDAEESADTSPATTEGSNG